VPALKPCQHLSPVNRAPCQHLSPVSRAPCQRLSPVSCRSGWMRRAVRRESSRRTLGSRPGLSGRYAAACRRSRWTPRAVRRESSRRTLGCRPGLPVRYALDCRFSARGPARGIRDLGSALIKGKNYMLAARPPRNTMYSCQQHPAGPPPRGSAGRAFGAHGSVGGPRARGRAIGRIVPRAPQKPIKSHR
jgi:hypothetical protein